MCKYVRNLYFQTLTFWTCWCDWRELDPAWSGAVEETYCASLRMQIVLKDSNSKSSPICSTVAYFFSSQIILFSSGRYSRLMVVCGHQNYPIHIYIYIYISGPISFNLICYHCPTNYCTLYLDSLINLFKKTGYMLFTFLIEWNNITSTCTYIGVKWGRLSTRIFCWVTIFPLISALLVGHMKKDFFYLNSIIFWIIFYVQILWNTEFQAFLFRNSSQITMSKLQ